MSCAPFLQLPLELLFEIFEKHELTITDLKNLRLVTPRFNDILGSKLFEKIGFDFEKKETQLWVTKRGRLNNVEMYKNTAFAKLPKEFFALVTKKSPLIESFAKMLSKKYDRLIMTFPNIQTIILKLDLQLLDFVSARSLISTICGRGDNTTYKGKSIDLSVSNLTNEWIHELNQVATAFANINVLSLSVDQSQLSDGNRIFMWPGKRMMPYWKNITHLELQGFRSYVDTIIKDAVASHSLSKLSHLTIGDQQLPPTSMNWVDPNLQTTQSRNRSIGARSNLYKLRSLKSLSLHQYETSANNNLNFIPTIWTGLGTQESVVQLESVNVGMMDMSLLLYLQGGLSTRSGSLRRLSMVAGINPTELVEKRGRFDTIASNNYISLANVFYDITLPGIQHIIEGLSFVCPSYLTITAGNRHGLRQMDEKYHHLESQMTVLPNGHIIHEANVDMHMKQDIKTYATISKHFSFTNRGLDYNLPSLENLGAWLQYEYGCFSSFMQAIRISPKLRHINLHIELVDLPGYHGGGDGDGDISMEGIDNTTKNATPGQDDVWTDVLEYFDHGSQWKKGDTTMDVEVSLLYKRRRERMNFVWTGRSWVALV